MLRRLPMAQRLSCSAMKCGHSCKIKRISNGYGWRLCAAMALKMVELWAVILGIDRKKVQKDCGTPFPLLIAIVPYFTAISGTPTALSSPKKGTSLLVKNRGKPIISNASTALSVHGSAALSDFPTLSPRK